MATLEKVTLSNRELSDLRKIRDNYAAEITAQTEKLRTRLEQFWQECRTEHSLNNDPYHFMDDALWVLRDATQCEQDAFSKMTKYK